VTGTGLQTPANPKVGAHAAHLGGGAFSNPLPCSSCHAVPSQTFPASLDHLDGSASVQFSALARQGVTSPAYGGGTCAVYCHGKTAALGNRQSPAWTSTAALTCNTCHPSAPTSGRHSSHAADGVACSGCHPGYRTGTSPLVDLTKHVNGTIDSAIGAWNTPGCGDTCH
jgi:predicted CxxxxCH...CXXCH cytochrome family protein